MSLSRLGISPLKHRVGKYSGFEFCFSLFHTSTNIFLLSCALSTMPNIAIPLLGRGSRWAASPIRAVLNMQLTQNPYAEAAAPLARQTVVLPAVYAHTYRDPSSGLRWTSSLEFNCWEGSPSRLCMKRSRNNSGLT